MKDYQTILGAAADVLSTDIGGAPTKRALAEFEVALKNLLNSANRKTAQGNIIPPADKFEKEIWYTIYKGSKNNRQPRGVLLASHVGDRVIISWSLCHSRLDRFNKDSGKNIARQRAHKFLTGWSNRMWMGSAPQHTRFPHSLYESLVAFTARAIRYYKEVDSKKVYFVSRLLENDGSDAENKFTRDLVIHQEKYEKKMQDQKKTRVMQ